MVEGSYDGIVVGGGAGGGTLAPRLAPSASGCALDDATGSRASRGLARPNVCVKNRCVSPEAWYDAARKGPLAAGPLFVGGAVGAGFSSLTARGDEPGRVPWSDRPGDRARLGGHLGWTDLGLVSALDTY